MDCEPIEASETQLTFIVIGPLSILVIHAWLCDGVSENAAQVPPDSLGDGILPTCWHLQVQGSLEQDWRLTDLYVLSLALLSQDVVQWHLDGVSANALSQYLHCPQDIQSHWTSSIAAIPLSQDINSQRTSTVQVPPLSQDLHCQRAYTVPASTLLSPNLHSHTTFNVAESQYSSTSTVLGPPLPEDLYCLSTSTVPGSTLSQVQLHGLTTSTVIGPQLLNYFNCYRTSTVAVPPLYH